MMEQCFEVRRNGTIKTIKPPEDRVPVAKIPFDGAATAVIFTAKDVKADLALEIAELNKTFLQQHCRIVH